jgi:Putative metallopeptidase
MDYQQTTHRVLVGRVASGLAFAILVICSASVRAQTPQQAAPPPPSASQQTAAQPPTPAEEEMREFRLRIRDYTKFVAQHPRIKNLSEKQREKLVEFVAGNMLFVMLHELGHAAMHEMGLPILGREEDQADNFAIFNLLKIGNKVSHRVLVEAAKGWFLSDRRDRRDGEPQAYFDEHGLDQQRAYNIVCLVYGSDPANMTDLADETKLPKDRRDSCVTSDYPSISSSWMSVLAPHRRPPDQPKTKIEVIYGDGKGDLEGFARGMRRIDTLNIVADLMSDALAWPQPFVIESQTCGDINAVWVSSTRRLTVCYELAQDFGVLYREFELASAKASTKQHKRNSKSSQVARRHQKCSLPSGVPLGMARRSPATAWLQRGPTTNSLPASPHPLRD